MARIWRRGSNTIFGLDFKIVFSQSMCPHVHAQKNHHKETTEAQQDVESLNQHSREQLAPMLAHVGELSAVPFSDWSALPGSTPTLARSVDLKTLSERAGHRQQVAARDSWVKRHLGLQADLLPQAPAPSAAAKRMRADKACWRAGLCICQGRGLLLKRMLSRFRAFLTQSFSQERFDKSLLADGFIVFSMAPTEGESYDVVCGPAQWYHIAMQYFRPWQSTLLALELVDPTGGIAEAVTLRVSPQVEDSSLDEHWPFATLWSVLAGCDLRRAWSVTLHQIVAAPRHLDRPFRPGVVQVQRLEVERACLWRGATAERPARRRQPQEQRPPRPRRRAAGGDGGGEGAEQGRLVDGGPSSGEDSGSDSTSNESPADGSDSCDDDAAGGELAEMLQGVLAEELAEDAVAAAEAEGPRDASGGSGSEYAEEDYQSVASSDLASVSSSLGSVGSRPPSSDSEDAIPPPPPAHAVPRERVQRHGLALFGNGHLLQEGAIRYNSGNHELYAMCTVEAHGRCILTRTCRSGRRVWQGRPLGFLAAWIAAGPRFPNKSTHLRHVPAFSERRSARRGLADDRQDSATLAAYLRYERDRHEGEESEPEEYR